MIILLVVYEKSKLANAWMIWEKISTSTLPITFHFELKQHKWIVTTQILHSSSFGCDNFFFRNTNDTRRPLLVGCSWDEKADEAKISEIPHHAFYGDKLFQASFVLFADQNIYPKFPNETEIIEELYSQEPSTFS